MFRHFAVEAGERFIDLFGIGLADIDIANDIGIRLIDDRLECLAVSLGSVGLHELFEHGVMAHFLPSIRPKNRSAEMKWL